MYTLTDLADRVREADLGVKVGGETIPMLLYADDVVFMAGSHQEAQKQLDILHEWCKTWIMKVNVSKTQVMHIRNPQRPRCTEKLFCGSQELMYVDRYKYLGVIFDECLSPKPVSEALTSSASQSFGRIVTMFRKLKNMGIRTYETLCTSYVSPILNYGAGVWGFQELSDPHVLQN